MLDIKQIRNHTDEVKAALSKRGDYDLAPLLALDAQQREIEKQRSELQARSNEVGKAVGQKIRNGADPKGDEVKALREEGNQVKHQIGECGFTARMGLPCILKEAICSAATWCRCCRHRSIS